MKKRKILIRSGISPLTTMTPEEIIANNSIGGNVGNLIYAYSIYRTLTTSEVELVPDNYRINHNDAEKINEEYDAYVIPLADAFREQFIPALKRYTELINKLTIPVYVIGVGLRAPFEPKLDEGFPFDKAVKDFVSAVLSKSSMIGVRGEITAKYLSKLGFKEGTDHIVIGCPSMYSFGRDLNIRETNITPNSKISVNSSMLSPENVLSFIDRSMKEYPNHYFIPQWMKEKILVYTGVSSLKENKYYPTSMKDDVYKNGRVPFFLNAQTWIDFLKNVDFSFGARLHGNITATIAGTPSILLPKDARMRELAEYHKLTHVFADKITDDTRLSDLIEQADFKSPETVQHKNFDKFIEFLNTNGISHIYDENYNGIAPLDRLISEVQQLDPIYPISTISHEEIAERYSTYVNLLNNSFLNKEDQLKKKVNNLENKNKEARKLIKNQEKTLNRRSVKLALKTANIVNKKVK
ncbi:MULTISPECIES: polysaccharide pyruvyl transferase family protein [Bacillaceae]|uniref:Polysaccharide pyruvyl transferase n=1 Tax=Alkalicoccobacillus plakortidis TaxID=444060 RepID=A0A9D5DUL8_9BACI|nr:MULTISPECIES: polysaccharide pyruvyl transferase family protein [Bacillaceae]KQL57043.1 polysaccharide pyruvyl transferase [Alkalicoccobacillus plakortidis]